jgi:hypothetical protein
MHDDLTAPSFDRSPPTSAPFVVKNRAGDPFIGVGDAVFDRQEVDRGFRIFSRISLPSSMIYVERAWLKDGSCVERLEPYLTRDVAAFICLGLKRFEALMPPRYSALGHGFEIWSSAHPAETVANAYLHVDSDEYRRTTKAELRTPLLGSVFYLGPHWGLRGGGTAVARDDSLPDRLGLFQSHPWSDILADHAQVFHTLPAAGRLLMFDGSLAHAKEPVWEAPYGCPRTAIFANLWDGRIGDVPTGACPVSPSQCRDQCGLPAP